MNKQATSLEWQESHLLKISSYLSQGNECKVSRECFSIDIFCDLVIDFS